MTAFEKFLYEDLYTTDSVPKQTNRTLSLDSVSLTDTVLKEPGKLLSESITLSDTITRDITRILADGLGITDIGGRFLLGRTLTDSTTLTDTIVKLAGKVISENETLSSSVYIAKSFIGPVYGTSYKCPSLP